jgi:hypothetical protein
MANDDDPVEGLRQCRDQFRANLMQLYSLIGTGYEMALQLDREPSARKRFFDESYFKSTRVWEVRTRRDLYREVFKFLLDAWTVNEKKRASKYATVVWHLDRKKIPPEAAASTIDIYDGIDAIARHGIPDPVILDPRDVGDGMTATGEKIDYGDEDDEEPEENLEIQTTGPSGKEAEETHHGNSDQSGNRAKNETDEAGTFMLVIRSERQRQKLLSVPLGYPFRVHLIPVEGNEAGHLFKVRRVVPPKLTSWLGIQPIIRDDEEWYTPDAWEYPEELCD